MFKVNNGVFIVDFEHSSHLFLVLLMLALSTYLLEIVFKTINQNSQGLLTLLTANECCNSAMVLKNPNNIHIDLSNDENTQ